MMLFQIYLMFFVIKVSLVLSQEICNRNPDEVRGEKQAADGRFSLRLKEEVTYYIPGNTYTGKYNRCWAAPLMSG